MTSLESSYRRLLAWYPQDYRREYEEEMLGVLMEAAEPDRRRPGPREAADLLLGVVRAHARRCLGRASGRHWRDACAVAGAVLAALMLAPAIPSLIYDVLGAVDGSSAGPADLLLLGIPLTTMLMAAGIVLGRRVLAGLSAWATLAGTAAAFELQVSLDPGFETTSYGAVVVALFAAIFLSVPAEPGRAIDLIRSKGPRGWWPIVAAGLAVAVLPWLTDTQPAEPWPLTAIMPALCGYAAGRAIWSPTGRRVALLLALPIVGLLDAALLAPSVVNFFYGYYDPVDVTVAAIMLAAFSGSAWLHRRRDGHQGLDDSTDLPQPT